MSLPLSRNTTYTVNSQIFSADLNDLQDQIIAIHGGRHPQRTLVVAPSAGLPESETADWASNGGQVSGSPLPPWDIPIVLPDGSRINEVRVRFQDSTIGPTILHVDVRQSTDGSVLTLGSDDSDGSGTAQTSSILLFNATVDHTNFTRSYYVRITTGSGTGIGRIYGVYVDYDFP